MMPELSSSWFAEAVGWSLVHFVWQGLLIAVLVWIALSLIQRNSNVRYAILCGALVLMALCPVVTLTRTIGIQNKANFHQSESARIAGNESVLDVQPVFVPTVDHKLHLRNLVVEPPSETSLAESSSAIDQDADDVKDIESRTIVAIFDNMEASFPMLVVVWSMGVFVLSVRLICSWFQIQRVKQSGDLVSTPELIQELNRLKREMQIRVRVALRESLKVHAPAVIGWFKPVILLPASSLTGLSIEQLTAILAHELAHIRRADYFVNLIQSVIETLLFYHPAVWWVSHQIRQERENCCDDWAVKMCKNEKAYVQALLHLEMMRSEQKPLIVAADGASLVKRVTRMLGHETRSAMRPAWLAGVLGTTIVFTVLSTMIPVQPAVSAAQDHASKLERKMEVKVVGPGGVPIKGASVKLTVLGIESGASDTSHFLTDVNGKTVVQLPDKYIELTLVARAEGFAMLYSKWDEIEAENGFPLPKLFTFKMSQSVEIGGIIVDENAQPIKDVVVEVFRRQQMEWTGNMIGHVQYPGRLASATPHPLNAGGAVKTDEFGQWVLSNVPPQNDALVVKLTHADYLCSPHLTAFWTGKNLDYADLKKMAAKITLKKGVRIHGTIFDPTGEPISDAVVVCGGIGGSTHKVNSDGSYRTIAMKTGAKRFAVAAPGYQPFFKWVNVSADAPTANFTLKPGKNLQIRFVDPKGFPIPNVSVQIQKWRRSLLYSKTDLLPDYVVDTKIPTRSDEKGLYTWNWAPDDDVTFMFSANGFFSRANCIVKAANKPHQMTLIRQPELQGSVTDESGRKIERFNVTPLILNDERNRKKNHKLRDKMIAGHKGQFSLKLDKATKYKLVVEATGFKTTTSRTFNNAIPTKPFAITMQPAYGKKYNVLNPAGKPVENALVIAVPQKRLMESRGYISFQEMACDNQSARSTIDGKVLLHWPESERTLVVVSDEGYGEFHEKLNSRILDLKLKKRGVLSVRLPSSLQSGGLTITHRKISRGPFFENKMYTTYGARYLYQRKAIETRMTASTRGIYRSEHIPPVPTLVEFHKRAQGVSRLGSRIAIDVKSGNNNHIEFENDRIIAGGIQLSERAASLVDLSESYYELRRVEPSVKIPSNLDSGLGNSGEFINTLNRDPWTISDYRFRERVLKFKDYFDFYNGFLNKEGRFSVNVYRPGRYLLTIVLKVRVFHDNQMNSKPHELDERAIEIADIYTELKEIKIGLHSSGQSIQDGNTAQEIEAEWQSEPKSVLASIQATLGYYVRKARGATKPKTVIADHWIPYKYSTKIIVP